jgi:thiol-disulfide isomerase/thioredoxin
MSSASAPNPPHLRFYTRPDCSLCDRVYPTLQRLEREGVITIESVNIEEDVTLSERYGTRIPVLEFPNGQLLEGRISEFRIRRLLQ